MAVRHLHFHKPPEHWRSDVLLVGLAAVPRFILVWLVWPEH